MILDPKWSLKSTANDPVKTWGMEWILWDWLQKRTDYKKESFFSRLLKKKGGRTLHLRSIYTRWKKNWINLKSMVLAVYFFLCRLLHFFLKNVSSFEKFKTGRTLRRKNSIILTPRSSTFLLRNTKLGTLYITRALLTLLIFLKAWNKSARIFNSCTGKGRTQSGRHNNTERNLFHLHVYLMIRSGISSRTLSSTRQSFFPRHTCRSRNLQHFGKTL